jgi:hypothetical protein
VQSQSAQRELNPHFRHGKAAGYRYIMGAGGIVELSKIVQSTWPDLNRRYRVTKAVSSRSTTGACKVVC